MRTPQPAFRAPRAARLSPLAAGLALAFSPFAMGISIVVNDGGDSGPGTLRQAITDANLACDDGTPGGNIPTISFTGPFVIAPSSPLPSFFCGSRSYNPTIDATSELVGGLPGVWLKGNSSNSNCGLDYSYNFTYGGNLTVKGMKITNFTYGSFSGGVCGVMNLDQSVLASNSIGARLDYAAPSTVGSFLTYGGNVFTGNTNSGIYVDGNSGHQIRNNLIGTPNGTAASPNGFGIYLDWGASASIQQNVISGNSNGGIYVQSDYGGGSIQGNLIGLKSSGESALGNGGPGIDISYSNGLMVSNNNIGSNDGAGITIYDSSVTLSNNTVGLSYGGGAFGNVGNGIDAFCSGYIDLDSNDIGRNLGDGVNFAGVSSGQVVFNTVTNNQGTGIRIASSTCSYGGFIPVDYNTGSGNGGDGVFAGMPGVPMTQGSYFDNGGKNIHSINGVAPDITSVVQNPDLSVTVTFTLSGPSDSSHHIQFYGNSSLVKPAGEVYLGDTFLTITTSPQSGSFTLGGPLLDALGFSKATGPILDNISATATGTSFGDNTSEMAIPMPTVTAPALTITPSSVDFGSLEVDTTSSATNITLRSVGDQDLVFSSIGSDPFCYGGPICYGGAFTCSTTCTTSTAYSRGQLCTITAQFSPSFVGTQSTSIYLCHNGIGSPQVLNLSGDAVPPPPLVLSPVDWDFGTVVVGDKSDTKTFSLTNRYDGNLGITLATTGDFEIVGEDCTPFAPALSTCHIQVDFAPTQSGGQTGQLTVNLLPPSDQAAGDARGASIISGGVAAKAKLTGNGIVGGSLVLPEAINVGTAIVGGSAISVTVDLRNEGTSPVTLTGLEISEGFTLANDCPPVLEAGQACHLTVGFTATHSGESNGTLTVMSSSGNLEVPVSALGQVSAAALIRISPTSIGFGSRMIGSASQTQSVSIQNVGAADATNVSVSSTSIEFFLAGTTCGSLLPAGATCAASVGFRPLGFGGRFGTLVVTSSAPNSPFITLSGTGCRPFISGGGRFSDGASSCSP